MMMLSDTPKATDFCPEELPLCPWEGSHWHGGAGGVGEAAGGPDFGLGSALPSHLLHSPCHLGLMSPSVQWEWPLLACLCWRFCLGHGAQTQVGTHKMSPCHRCCRRRALLPCTLGQEAHSRRILGKLLSSGERSVSAPQPLSGATSVWLKICAPNQSLKPGMWGWPGFGGRPPWPLVPHSLAFGNLFFPEKRVLPLQVPAAAQGLWGFPETILCTPDIPARTPDTQHLGTWSPRMTVSGSVRSSTAWGALFLGRGCLCARVCVRACYCVQVSMCVGCACLGVLVGWGTWTWECSLG